MSEKISPTPAEIVLTTATESTRELIAVAYDTTRPYYELLYSKQKSADEILLELATHSKRIISAFRDQALNLGSVANQLGRASDGTLLGYYVSSDSEIYQARFGHSSGKFSMSMSNYEEIAETGKTRTAACSFEMDMPGPDVRNVIEDPKIVLELLQEAVDDPNIPNFKAGSSLSFTGRPFPHSVSTQLELNYGRELKGMRITSKQFSTFFQKERKDRDGSNLSAKQDSTDKFEITIYPKS